MAFSLLTVITGLVFVLIITRSLTAEQLGTWSLIGGYFSYVLIIEPIIAHWATREIARGTNSGKTAIISSSALSAVGLGAYIIIALFVGGQTDANLDDLVFASILIPFMFVNRTLTSIGLAWKPQLVQYGVLSLDISKVPMAIIFIHFLDLGIPGVVFSMLIAYITSSILLGYASRKKLKESFKWAYLKKWLKLFWLPIYVKFPSLVVLDVVIFSTITGSVVGLAYWTVASTVGYVAKHTQHVSLALYPKLLSGGKKEFLQENLSLQFFFAIPVVSISIAFAEPALFALNPIYREAGIIVILLALRIFLKNFNAILSQSMQGIEEIDTDTNATQKDYFKSKLFHIPTIKLIEKIIYLVLLAIGLYIIIFLQLDFDLVTYWAIIAFITQIPFSIYFYFVTRKSFSKVFNKKSVLKYFLAAIIVFAAGHFLFEETGEYKESIYEFLPLLLAYIIPTTLAYAGLVYIMDKQIRKLFKSIFEEVIKR